MTTTSPPALELREHTPTRSDEPWIEQGAEFLNALKIKAIRAPGQDDWTLTPGSRVGFASVVGPAGRTALRVLPKIADLDLFFLADYAFGRKSPVTAPRLGPALLERVARDPSVMLLLWYVNDINAFATRWLRRTYSPRRTVLDGEARGEVLFDRYVEDHVALADPVHVPVRVIDRTLDTPNNRLLKAGLRHAAALTHLLPVPASRRPVQRAVAAALPRFAQVADVPPAAAALRGVSTRGPLRHYASVVGLTLDFLAGTLLSETAGDGETTAFFVDLPLLFQEALRSILTETPGCELLPKRPTAQILDPLGEPLTTTKVDPDYVLVTPGRDDLHLLLDAKYKRAVDFTGREADDMLVQAATARVTVKRADVYQATAYRHHKHWPGARAGLVYPVALPDGIDLPQPHTVDGFDGPVHLLFLDVGPRARMHLVEFRSHVLALLYADLHRSPS